MNKQAPQFEWHIVEDEIEWTRLSTYPHPDRTPALQGGFARLRFLWAIAAILLVVSGAAGWWRQRNQVKLNQSETALGKTAQQELQQATQAPLQAPVSFVDGQSNAEWPNQLIGEYNGLRATLAGSEPGQILKLQLSDVDFYHDQAVATLVLTANTGGPAYRQTRFYRRTKTGWVRTPPVAALWGDEQSLETPYLRFYFRRNDARAVAAAAPRVDALYAAMQRNLGWAAAPNAAKPIIEVSVLISPGADAFPTRRQDRYVVPSPALYLAPVALTDADLLAQALALPLFDNLLAQAVERQPVRLVWMPMLRGLRLWQLWDLDLPLAVWREEVVRWVYNDLPGSERSGPIALPVHYAELCAMHALWMPYPERIKIPLFCNDREQTSWYFSWWFDRNALTQLTQLAAPGSPDIYLDGMNKLTYPGQTVALATLFEYVVATYGRERLPALLLGLSQHSTWETLIPAVFGVSQTEFEAGWQAYLAVRFSSMALPSLGVSGYPC